MGSYVYVGNLKHFSHFLVQIQEMCKDLKFLSITHT